MNFEGKAVYLSGPMDGKHDLNRAAFAAAEQAFYRAGAHFVFNPCEYYRVGDEMPDWPRGEYMRRDLHMLTGGSERPHFDCIALLPGWTASRGASAEYAAAYACDMPMYFIAPDFEDALRLSEPCVQVFTGGYAEENGRSIRE